MISKHWDTPLIEVGISEVGIDISMPITNYVQAIAKEMGNPVGILTRAQLLEALYIAASKVQFKMQEVTSEAMVAMTGES